MEPSQVPVAASSTCRHCGGAAGLSGECPRCEHDLDAYIASLVAEVSELEEIVEVEGDLEAIAGLAPEPVTVEEPEFTVPEPEPLAAEPAALEPPAPEAFTVEAATPDPPAHEPAPPVSSAPPSPPAAHEPRPASVPPPRRGRRTLIAAVALGALATAGSLAVSQGDPGEAPPAPAPKQAATDPPAQPDPPARPDPPAEPGAAASPAESNGPTRFGDWSGQVQASYADGTTDELTVSLSLGALKPDKVVGTATSQQNAGECRGSLTSLGRLDGVFRFAYAERNTAECVGTSRIKLTPRGEDRIAYEEITDLSVNRGTLTRD